MQDRTDGKYLMTVGSLLVALLLSILPLPTWALWCEPQWVFLVLMYWLLYEPACMGIGWVCLLGLIQDLLMGTLLGQHAFVYVLLAFLVPRLTAFLSRLPLWQQVGCVFVLSFLNIALQHWIVHLFGVPGVAWKSLWSVITSMLVWPWLVYLFNYSKPMSTKIEILK